MSVGLAMLLILALIHALATVFLAAQGLHSLWLVLRFLRHRRGRGHDDLALCANDDAPDVLVQLPVFNERDVVARLVAAVGEFDWPRDRLRVQLLDDSDDDTLSIGRTAVARLVEAGIDAAQVTRDDRTGFKAGALAHGLDLDARHSRGPAPFVAIFDADFVPPTDFLRRALPPILTDRKVAFVQGRWEHLNDATSLLARSQAIGIDGHFAVEQAARAWSGLALNFNGTCGLWRREAIDDAGGWQHDTLTEDLDLSYRAQLRGWRAHYLIDLAAPGEIPESIEAWRSQQFRWAKGSIQCALKLLPAILTSRWPRKRKAAAALHLTHYLVHPAILVSLLLAPFVATAHHQLGAGVFYAGIVLMAAGLVPPILLYVVASRALQRPASTLLALPFLMSFGVGCAVANSRAVLEAMRGKASAFVRTPKRGDGVASYSARSASGTAELVCGAWGAFGLAAMLRGGLPWFSPLILLYVVGFLVQGLMLMRHRIAELARLTDMKELARDPSSLLGLTALGATAALATTDLTWRHEPITFAGLGAVVGLCCHLMVRRERRLGESRARLAWVLLVGVALQLTALGLPTADDVHRYALEGAQLRAGENPYVVAPSSTAIELGAGSAAEINHPEMTAIYPPAMLMVHGVIALLGPGTMPFRMMVVIAVLAVAGLIMRLLARQGRPRTLVAAWLWNPVVILFLSGGGHHDVFMALALLAAMTALVAGAHRRSLAWASIAVLLKPFAVVAMVPPLARLGKRSLVIPIVITVAVAAPFAGAGRGMFASLLAFGGEMHFHGLLEPVLRGLLGFGNSAVSDPFVVRAVLAALLAASLIWLAHRSRGEPSLSRLARALALVLLVSPTLHPWYFTALVALLPFTPSRALLAWTCAAPLYWLHGLAMPAGAAWMEWPWATTLAHLPFIIWMLAEAFGPVRVRHDDARSAMEPLNA